MKTTLAIRQILALPTLLLLLAGCQLLPKKTPEAPAKAPITYRQEIKRLPGATFGNDGLQALYPGEALFGQGAVLPFPGGMETLQPLIDWLHANKLLTAVATVRADNPDKAYALELATTRMQLLERMFTNRGLSGERIEWKAEVGAGAALDLKFQLSVGNSDGSKS